MDVSQSAYSAGYMSQLGVKKKKPRSTAVVEAANDRLRAGRIGLLPVKEELVENTECVGKDQSRSQSTFVSDATSSEETTKRKGLRHFAVRVCKKVEEKQYTSYNEVADELVIEEKDLKRAEVERGGKLNANLQKRISKGGTLVDEKNIRRRVYDSLNVLMAMGIIEKNRKVIRWRGLAVAGPRPDAREADKLRASVEEQRRTVEEKRVFCQKIREQANDLANLVARNSASWKNGVDDLFTSANKAIPLHQLYNDRISIPFLLVRAGKDTSIGLTMDRSCEDVCFTFNSEFSILDDRETLKRMKVLQRQSSSSAAESNSPEVLDHSLIEAMSQESSPLNNFLVPLCTGRSEASNLDNSIV